MKYVDDSGDIDLFSEIDRNHEKMIDDGKLCQVYFCSQLKYTRMQQVRSWTWIPCAFFTLRLNICRQLYAQFKELEF